MVLTDFSAETPTFTFSDRRGIFCVVRFPKKMSATVSSLLPLMWSCVKHLWVLGGKVLGLGEMLRYDFLLIIPPPSLHPCHYFSWDRYCDQDQNPHITAMLRTGVIMHCDNI